MLARHLPTYKSTHRIDIPKPSLHFFVIADFNSIVSASFCVISAKFFYFACIVDIDSFVWVVPNIMFFEMNLLKYRIIDAIGNWHYAVAIAVPRHKLFPKKYVFVYCLTYRNLVCWLRYMLLNYAMPGYAMPVQRF